MSTFIISEEERVELRALARTTTHLKTGIRARVILALADRYSLKEVAVLFLIDEATAAEWRGRYERKTLFKDQHKPYAGKLTHGQREVVSSYVEQELITDCRQIIQFIQDHYQITYTRRGAARLLRKLGFSYKSLVLEPAKRDHAAQVEWIAQHQDLYQAPAQGEVILFADASFPQHNTNTGRAWIKQGSERRIKRGASRKRAHIIGALNIHKMRVTASFPAQTVNSENPIQFLEHVEADYPAAQRIRVIADQGRHIKCAEIEHWLAQPGRRLEMVYLPTYSPNLNLIERLWGYLHRYVIGNQYHEKFKDFQAKIHRFFEHFADHETALRQFIGTQPHLMAVT